MIKREVLLVILNLDDVISALKVLVGVSGSYLD
jgi:hypothetical protein